MLHPTLVLLIVVVFFSNYMYIYVSTLFLSVLLDGVVIVDVVVVRYNV